MELEREGVGEPGGLWSGRHDRGQAGEIVRVRERCPAVEQLGGEVRPVAYQQHVAAGSVRGFGAADDVAGDAGAFHVEVVAEDHALEAHPAAQHILEPEGREAGGLGLGAGVGIRVDHMRGHHPGELAAEAVPIRRDVLVPHGVEVAFIDRHVVVRIGLDEAVAGEVLADRTHARLRHAGDQRQGERGDGLRVAVEGAVADGAAAAVVEVQHRGKAEVDAVRAQLGGKHEAGRARGLERGKVVVFPQRAQAAHGRQAAEAIGAEALHPAPFVVDRDDQRRVAQRADVGGQRAQLVRAGEVARKKNHTADQRVAQALALLVGQRDAGDVDHDGATGAADR